MPGETADPSRKVLIIEDTDTCAATLEMAFLAIADVDVVCAGTAREALRLLEGDAGTICALVTDLHMPHLDGFELIERVRSHPRLASIPIVVVSGDTDPQTPERILRLGADAFFAKPYSPGQVRRKLEELLNANR